MYILISFIFWLIAAPLGLTAIGEGASAVNLKYLTLVFIFISVVFACVSLSVKKTSVGTLLIVFLNIVLAYFVVVSIVNPTLGL